MSFLEVGGVGVTVLDARNSQKLEKPGRRERSYRGLIRDARRNVRRSWTMEAKFLDYDKAVSLQGILEGKGHMIDFADSLTSWTGLSPMPGYRARMFAGTNGKVTASGYAAPADSVSVDEVWLQYDAQLPDDWTIVWWENVGFTTTTWRQIVLRSDGQSWDDAAVDLTVGRPGDTSKFGVEVIDGIVNVYLNVNTLPRIDDMLILPYRMHADHIVDLANQTTAKFSPLPALRCSGDFVNEEYVLCFGEITGVAFLQKPADVGGAWVNNSQTIRFKLHEVKTSFLLDESFDEVQGDVTVPNIPGTVGDIPNFEENP